MPHEAILGDTNAQLMETYRVVRKDPESLYRRLVRIPRTSEAYYRWRALAPWSLDRNTRALRFVYLNRNCFNGIYRTNLAGGFNVPYGGKKGVPPGHIEKSDFLRCAEQLNRADLVSGDFSETLLLAKKGDFIYLDPPYATSSRRVFTEYGAKLFATGDVPTLARQLRRLEKLGAEFLVSYADCAEARELASEWNAVRLLVRRHVAGFVGHRRKACEWLISNMKLPELDAEKPMEVENGD